MLIASKSFALQFGDIPATTDVTTLWLAPSQISNTAYDITSWDGVTSVAPSKNALRDYFTIFDTDGDGKVNVLDMVAGITNTNSSGVIQTPLAQGNLTAAGTDGIVITNGTSAVIGSGTSIAQHVADASHNGYLSSTDFNTFSSGSGNVSNSGTPTIGQMAQWTNATTIKGVTISGSGATMSIDTSGVVTISAIANGTLSNSAITIAGTSTSLGGTITLDTITGVSSNGFLTRTGANALTNTTAPSGAVVGTTDTQTLTNKWIKPRATATPAPGATPAVNTDSFDLINFTSLGTAITSMTTALTGTPVLGQKLVLGFKDDGTPRAITWGASFQNGPATLLATTALSKQHWVGLVYDGTKWTCFASDATGY